jgi:hypothetical protein
MDIPVVRALAVTALTVAFLLMGFVTYLAVHGGGTGGEPRVLMEVEPFDTSLLKQAETPPPAAAAAAAPDAPKDTSKLETAPVAPSEDPAKAVAKELQAAVPVGPAADVAPPTVRPPANAKSPTPAAPAAAPKAQPSDNSFEGIPLIIPRQ